MSPLPRCLGFRIIARILETISSTFSRLQPRICPIGYKAKPSKLRSMYKPTNWPSFLSLSSFGQPLRGIVMILCTMSSNPASRADSSIMPSVTRKVRPILSPASKKSSAHCLKVLSRREFGYLHSFTEVLTRSQPPTWGSHTSSGYWARYAGTNRQASET